MKPIDSKELPKVIGLGVASVGMIGFFAMTLMGSVGKKKSNPPANPPAATVATAAAPTPGAFAAPAMASSGQVAGQPVTTLAMNDQIIELGGPHEPFRNVLPEPNQANPFPKISIDSKLPRLGGRLRGGPISVGGFGPGARATVGAIGAIGGVAPAGIPEPLVRLDGVMMDRKSYAVITCNGRTEMYRVGSRFAGMFEVIGINQSGASFRGPRGIFRLEVGEERVPPPPAPTQAASRIIGGGDQFASIEPVLPLPGR